ncbi:MAG: hypothetical protein KBS91_04950 [Firmicutes bacterium]|nr:hypothetical protein [Candidatus Caballimonas caccae]
MKKFISVLVLITFVFSLFACESKVPKVIQDSETCIVISTFDCDYTITDKSTLLDYMNYLKNSGEIDFELNGTMLQSINDTENKSDFSYFWALYTSDKDNSNDAWGTVVYNEEIYGSAIFGVDTLRIKENCLYIWLYQESEW